MFIYSGFVIPWKRFEKFLATQPRQLVTYIYCNWAFKWSPLVLFLEWPTTLLCLLLLLIICLHILLMLLKKGKEKFISYKLKTRERELLLYAHLYDWLNSKLGYTYCSFLYPYHFFQETKKLSKSSKSC